MDKTNTTLLSVIIACYDIERTNSMISKYINSEKNKERKIEFIIGYDSSSFDVVNKIDKIRFSANDNVRTVPCYKITDNYETVLSKNEIYVQCHAEAQGVYTMFCSDYIVYNDSFFDDCIKNLVKDGSDLFIFSYIVNWPTQSNTKYDVLDSKKFSVAKYINESPLYWWYSNIENKIIKSEIASLSLNKISTYYRKKTSHLHLDNVILTTEILLNVHKTEFLSNLCCILLWSDEDNYIKNYAIDNNCDNYYIEIINTINWLKEKYNNLVINGTNVKIDQNYVKDLIALNCWRYDWAIKGLTNYFMNRFPELKKFDTQKVDAKGVEVNIESLNSNKINQIAPSSNLKVNIFVSMHKESYIPKNNRFIKAIQVGTEETGYKFKNTIHDNDSDDNISSKNRMYCEMTAQYYVWKNIPNLDYYGFWHYRRYFSFNDEEIDNEYGFILHDSLNEISLKKSFIDECHILNYCMNYDIILPRKWHCIEDKEYTVYEHWRKHFNINDLNVTLSVIKDKFPNIYPSAIETIYSTSAIFCNMFIMNKKYFFDYSEFCFKVLFEVEKIIDQKKYNTEEYRTLGHIGERLLAIYVKYIENSDPSVRIRYTGRTHYGETKKFIDVIPHPINIVDTFLQKKNVSGNSSLYKDNVNKFKFYKERINTNKCVSIMLASSDYFMKFTDVLLESIKINSNDDTFYDIIICHTHISDSNQEIAKSIFKSTNNILLRFVDVSKNFQEYNSLHVNRNFTYETYFRFLILDLFKEYDRLLYLDCDTVVNCSIDSLFNIEMDDKFIAAVRDYDFIANSLKNPDFYYNNIIKYTKIDSIFNYFQAGVILFNLKNIKDYIKSDELFKIALARNWFYHDQDVLNSVFNKHVKFIDDRWNVFTLLDLDSERSQLLTTNLVANYAQSYRNSRSNPYIIHYAGVPKPWQSSHVDLDVYFWKYARSSPFYELILSEKINGIGEIQDWIIFTSDNDSKSRISSIPFFRINTIKQEWTNDYCVIDFIYLSDNKEISFNTLYISMSMFPHETETMWLDVKQFYWSDSSITVFQNISFIVTKNLDLDIYVKYVNKYEGFSFKVRQLDSRSIQKPYISILNHHYVTN